MYQMIMKLKESWFVIFWLVFQTSLKANDTPGSLDPFQLAQPLTFDTLDGPIKYPSKLLPNNTNTPIIFHTFNNHSAFLECLWTSNESLQSLVLNSPANVRYVFMTTGDDGYRDAIWMRGQMKSTMRDLLDDKKIKWVVWNEMRESTWICKVTAEFLPTIHSHLFCVPYFDRPQNLKI